MKETHLTKILVDSFELQKLSSAKESKEEMDAKIKMNGFLDVVDKLDREDVNEEKCKYLETEVQEQQGGGICRHNL